jgi:hypothetical protein
MWRDPVIVVVFIHGMVTSSIVVAKLAVLISFVGINFPTKIHHALVFVLIVEKW